MSNRAELNGEGDQRLHVAAGSYGRKQDTRCSVGLLYRVGLIGPTVSYGTLGLLQVRHPLYPLLGEDTPRGSA